MPGGDGVQCLSSDAMCSPSFACLCAVCAQVRERVLEVGEGYPRQSTTFLAHTLPVHSQCGHGRGDVFFSDLAVHDTLRAGGFGISKKRMKQISIHHLDADGALAAPW